MILSSLPIELWNKIFKIKSSHFRYELSCKECEFGCLCVGKPFCSNQDKIMETGYCLTCYEKMWECMSCSEISFHFGTVKYSCDSCDEDTCFSCAESIKCIICSCPVLVCNRCVEKDYDCYHCQSSS